MPHVRDLISFTDAAHTKGCSRTTLYRAARDGRLTAINVGERQMLVQNDDFRAFEPKRKGARVRKLNAEANDMDA